MAAPVEGPDNVGGSPTRPPVQVAGQYRVTRPTLADLALMYPMFDQKGNLAVAIYNPGGTTGIGQGAYGGLSVEAVIKGAIDAGSSVPLRTPTTFKHFASTAITAGVGATIWTPAGGKKFRLMGWLIASSAAGQLLFGDNVVGTIVARSEAVVAAGVSNVSDGLGNGILSAAANNVLKLDGPTGNVAGMVWGTEE